MMTDDSKSRFPDVELMDDPGLADPAAPDSGSAFNLSSVLALMGNRRLRPVRRFGSAWRNWPDATPA